MSSHTLLKENKVSLLMETFVPVLFLLQVFKNSFGIVFRKKKLNVFCPRTMILLHARFLSFGFDYSNCNVKSVKCCKRSVNTRFGILSSHYPIVEDGVQLLKAKHLANHGTWKNKSDCEEGCL